MTARHEAIIAVLVAERDVSGLEEVLEEAVPEFQRGDTLSIEQASRMIDWMKDQPRRD